MAKSGGRSMSGMPKGATPWSEASSVNSQLVYRNISGSPSHVGSKKRKTSSIQINMAGYPKAPQPANSLNFITCQWCGETHEKRRFEGDEWRKHVDKDLKPYICISENCRELPCSFTTFKAWNQHMTAQHGLAWYQDVYPPSSWVCAICLDASSNGFQHPNELYIHMKSRHDFSETQLAAIVHLSKIQVQRRPDICPLCCLHVEDGPEGLPKPMLPGHGENTVPSTVRKNDKEPAELMARHVAAHLQALMFLTIRLMSIRDDDEECASVASSAVDTGDNSTRKMPSRPDSPSEGSAEVLANIEVASEDGKQPGAYDQVDDIPETTENADWLAEGYVAAVQPLLENSATKSNNTAMWQLQQTLNGHGRSVWSVAFSHDSKLLASGSADRTIRLWDTATWQLQQTLNGHGSSVYSVAFSHDSKLLASGSVDRTIRLWDTATWQLQQTLNGHGSSVGSVAFSHDSKLLASGSADRTIRLWDTATWQLQQTLNGHGSPVGSVAFSHDSKLLVSGSDDNTIRLWDTATWQLQQTLNGHGSPVGSVAFSHDSKLLVSGSDDNTIRLWDTATWQLQQTLNGHGSSVGSVAFSHDSKLLASGSADNTIRLWDTATWQLQQTLNGHGSSVGSVAFSHDSKLLASGSVDRTIRLWDRVIVT
ncbi:WD40-repeat-containing domain protein [Lasiosphaeris hirsuta]|uniref:Mitochondrial division protein 1 n=1 Tax=Lasiosphaeris hirsuta TaxID=260670 RepID=A0AA40DQM6_9PEZI|nr:WD40-repeat-containing domain protein [Lasiosphaeris hirsuta]